MLSLIFALQYDENCSNVLYCHIFDFLSIIYSKGIIEFMKNFNWPFLILILFFSPKCINIINNLIKLIGEIIERYGKVVNTSVSKQNNEDKKNFEKIKEEIYNNEKNENVKELINLVLSKIKGKSKDFEERSKIIIDDPISDIENLTFDCNYRYEQRRYSNVLIISKPKNIDIFYKYIRIMYDIDKKKINQKYRIELIYLVEGDNEDTKYEDLKKIYKKAQHQIIS